jgi:hypothetical protein
VNLLLYFNNDGIKNCKSTAVYIFNNTNMLLQLFNGNNAFKRERDNILSITRTCFLKLANLY